MNYSDKLPNVIDTLGYGFYTFVVVMFIVSLIATFQLFTDTNNEEHKNDTILNLIVRIIGMAFIATLFYAGTYILIKFLYLWYLFK